MARRHRYFTQGINRKLSEVLGAKGVPRPHSEKTGHLQNQSPPPEIQGLRGHSRRQQLLPRPGGSCQGWKVQVFPEGRGGLTTREAFGQQKDQIKQTGLAPCQPSVQLRQGSEWEKRRNLIGDRVELGSPGKKHTGMLWWE